MGVIVLWGSPSEWAIIPAAGSEYRKTMWAHQPLTDFWRVGRGIAKKLEENGMFTMGDVARCSERDEDLLYKLFGKNAELLIDHAWGWEPTTIKAIKAYRPSTNSLGSGQVLHCPYEADKAKLVLREMADLLTLDLVDKGLVTDQIVVTVGYDIENLTDPKRRAKYSRHTVRILSARSAIRWGSSPVRRITLMGQFTMPAWISS